jgi:hypothetical protein
MTRTHHALPHFATRHATDIQRRCYHQNAGLWHVQRQHIQLSVSWLCQQTRGPGTACPRRHQALGLHTDPQLSHLRARNRTTTHYFYLPRHRATAPKPLPPNHSPLASGWWHTGHHLHTQRKHEPSPAPGQRAWRPVRARVLFTLLCHIVNTHPVWC